MGSAKLSFKKAKRIRGLFKEGIPPKQIAKMFNTSRSTVLAIKRGVIWKEDNNE